MPSFAKILSLLCTLSAVSFALPQDFATRSPPSNPPNTVNRCSNPIIRKEWRTLTNTQKDAFINAVKCLHNKPGKLTSQFPGATTRFEDFIAEHKVQTPFIHQVGHFLPWHRLFLHEYERSLRAECGYTGALPYWDYTKDYTDITLSPIWDPVHGFGGNGVVPPGEEYQFFVPYCVKDGPFADWKIHVAQFQPNVYEEHCLARNFWKDIATYWVAPEREVEIKAQTTYGAMARTLEGEPDFNLIGMHGTGHFMVGGSASDAYTSNAEPTFYLHHANLDRIWWEWQSKSYSAHPERFWDMDGSIIPRWPDTFQPADYSNLSTGNVTLGFDIHVGNLNPALHVKVVQVMDIKGGKATGAVYTPANKPGVLCYNYDTTPNS